MKIKALVLSVTCFLLPLALLVTCAASSKTQIPGNVSGFRELLLILKNMQTDIYAALDANRAYVDSNFTQQGNIYLRNDDTTALFGCNYMERVVYLEHKYENDTAYSVAAGPQSAGIYYGYDFFVAASRLTDSSIFIQAWRDSCNAGIDAMYIVSGIRKRGAD